MKITDFKHCSKCKTHKHRDQFAKNWQTKDGLNSWCRLCHKAHRIARKGSREVGTESLTTASDQTTCATQSASTA